MLKKKKKKARHILYFYLNPSRSIALSTFVAFCFIFILSTCSDSYMPLVMLMSTEIYVNKLADGSTIDLHEVYKVYHVQIPNAD